MDLSHFDKLKKRYCRIEFSRLETSTVLSELQNKKLTIENRNFGRQEDGYELTTQIKVIVNGLFLKIYYFLEKSILHTNEKDYISAISLHRLCVEHIAMVSLVMNRMNKYLIDKDFLKLFALCQSFCMGERIFWVETIDKKDNKKFSTRSEHVSTALREFDKRHHGLGIQFVYDILSNHSHVTPTSSLRMLYRQKLYNVPEIKQDFSKIKLSTISNSHEKLATGMVYSLYAQFLVVIENEKELMIENKVKEFEKLSREIELQATFQPEKFEKLKHIQKTHDKLVQEYLEKINKYVENT